MLRVRCEAVGVNTQIEPIAGDRVIWLETRRTVRDRHPHRREGKCRRQACERQRGEEVSVVEVREGDGEHEQDNRGDPRQHAAGTAAPGEAYWLATHAHDAAESGEQDQPEQRSVGEEQSLIPADQDRERLDNLARSRVTVLHCVLERGTAGNPGPVGRDDLGLRVKVVEIYGLGVRIRPPWPQHGLSQAAQHRVHVAERLRLDGAEGEVAQ
jgi:hypothetical protein